MKRRALDQAKLARNLGSQPRGRVPAKSGYFGALELAAEVRRRFKSPAGGGRPTDPDWTAKRLIPMRPQTLARLEKLAKDVSRSVRGRVEPLQLAALIIECHLAPTRRSQEAREALRGLAKYRGKEAWEGNLDELRRSRLTPDARSGRVSAAERVSDRVASASEPPDLSADLRGPAGRSQGASRRQKGSRRGREPRPPGRSAKPFPDRSAFRRAMPALDPTLSSTIIQGRKDRP